MHVALANFDDPVGQDPMVHVHVDDRAPWFEITDSLPQHGGLPGEEPKAEA